MTLIEKIKQICDSWNVEDKPYMNGLHRTDIEEMLEQMYDWTKEQMIEKACEYMTMTIDFFNNGEFNRDRFINDFKKAMEKL